MRTRTGRSTALALALTGMMIVGAGTASAVNITVGNANLPAEGSGNVTVTLDPQGSGVVATLNDIRLPDGVTVTEQVVTATLAAAITAESTDIPLGAGQADTLPSFGIVIIEGEEISYSSITGDTLVVAARGETPAAHAAGTAVTVPTNVPECSATDAITTCPAPCKEVVFAYLPDRCLPNPATCNADAACDSTTTDDCCCAGVRAIVIALGNLTEITSVTGVYTCKLQTTLTTGTLPLECPGVGGTCTGDGDCGSNEVCNTTDGVCVPAAPFQPAQSGDSPLVDGQGNLPTTCASGQVSIGGASCIGDCDNGGSVTGGELLTALDILLGEQDPEACPAYPSGVSGASLLVALDNLSFGCE
jgi:hypothetical protein